MCLVHLSVEGRSICRGPPCFNVLVDANFDHAPSVLPHLLGAADNNGRAFLGVCQQRLIRRQVLFGTCSRHRAAKLPRLRQTAGDDQAPLITRHLGWRTMPLRIGHGVKAGVSLHVLFDYRRSFPVGGNRRLQHKNATRPPSGHRGEAYQPPCVPVWIHGFYVLFGT